MNDLRRWQQIVEVAAGPDPRFQYHLSVEPDLVAGKSFAEQTRTVSSAGARGDAGDGNGDIYTTHNPQYWSAQMAYEEVGDEPGFVYLVFVKDGGPGSIDAAHQDVSPPADVIVLARVGEIDTTSDRPPDISRMQWVGTKWVKAHGDEVIQRYGKRDATDALHEVARPGDRHAAMMLLKQKGYDVLGHGDYATVLTRYGDPWVIKLFDATDRAYPAFVSFVMANPSKHFPKFKRGFIEITPDYRAVRMERLTPLDQLQGHDELVEMIDSYLVVAESNRSEHKSMYYDDHAPLAEALAKKNPSLCQALDLLDAGLIKRGFLADISDDNLAIRQDGEIVLFDPICGRGEG